MLGFKGKAEPVPLPQVKPEERQKDSRKQIAVNVPKQTGPWRTPGVLTMENAGATASCRQELGVSQQPSTQMFSQGQSRRMVAARIPVVSG